MIKKLVVHCKEAPYDIYIGRPSIWGNPFILGLDGDRREVIYKFEEYLLGNDELLERLPELKDKVLGCWCAPLVCHGDVLARYANYYHPCPICGTQTMEYVGRADSFFCYKHTGWMEFNDVCGF